MKATIAAMASIPKELANLDELKEELTVVGKGYQDTDKIVRCFKTKPDCYEVPVPYALKKGWIGNAEDLTPDVKKVWNFSEFYGRNNQEEVIQKTIKYLLENRSGRISASTGWGKSIVSLEIAKRMNQNVLFLAHKDDILKQIEMTAKVYFNTKCGYIKGKKENPNEMVTLSTMQTMAKRVAQNPSYLSNWGMVIGDEFHRASCESYIKIMEALNRRYTLGISATFRRGDGLEPVWDNYIGELICEGILGKRVVPKLEAPIIAGTGIKMSDFFDWQGELSHTAALNNIAKNRFFNSWLAAKVKELLEQGRRVLLVTNRKEQLEILEDFLKELGIESGVYAGGKHKGKTLKDSDLCAGMKKKVVLATVKKVGEGFDETMFLGKEEANKIKPLDTIIIASPISDPEQVIGRIGRRECANHPLIIHPIIDLPYCKALFNKCVKSTYKPLGIMK